MSESPKGPLLEVDSVHKTFWMDRRRIEVLKGVSLTIHEADTVAIVGASGAGKSTLLHLLGTLDTPTEGDIRINGTRVLEMSEEELAAFRNTTIGFVFQAHYLLPEFSALENVMMPAFIQRMSKGQAQRQATMLLDWVGLSHRLEHRPGELSGGERQRVALCRALIMKPRILLADEPTGNLDSKTADGIHSLLISLKEDWKVTPIVVTHNLVLAEKMERCFHLVEGRIVERSSEPPAEPQQREEDPPEVDEEASDSVEGAAEA